MKAKSLKKLREELVYAEKQDLVDLCLQLARFKVENKELLTYELFYRSNKDLYLSEIEAHVDKEFEGLNDASYFYLKKGVQKINRHVKKYSRIAKDPEIEVHLLLYFLKKFKAYKPDLLKQKILNNMYHREYKLVVKRIEKLHPDLQFDYEKALEEVT
ncbi:MAG TPA: hypothetical protein VKX30_01160 [Flavobacteriaceae bacterium]|nr:hypothetical protein [Flavobacteriaceae bacterium]